MRGEPSPEGSAPREAGSAPATVDAGRPRASDAGGLDAERARPEAGLSEHGDGGVLARLAGKSMYSSKPSGAASWLVSEDPNACKALIDSDMAAAGPERFPVFSLYRYFPNSGTDAVEYASWLGVVAAALGQHRGVCVVVLEPDAFALRERADVDTVLDQAIEVLASRAPNAAIFLDIGHSNWLGAEAVIARVKNYRSYAKIAGWALNTSNFQPTEREVGYARALFASSQKPSIIDTSRNGLGRTPSTIFNPPESEWDPGPPFAWHPDDPAVLFNYYNKPSNERD